MLMWQNSRTYFFYEKNKWLEKEIDLLQETRHFDKVGDHLFELNRLGSIRV